MKTDRERAEFFAKADEPVRNVRCVCDDVVVTVLQMDRGRIQSLGKHA